MIDAGMTRKPGRYQSRRALRERLAEAEETLQALRDGQVDALVVRGAGGDQIYSLHGAEEPYRNLVEQMREGAVVLAQSGDILYANASFRALVAEGLESVLGSPIGRFMCAADKTDFSALLGCGTGTLRTRFVTSNGSSIEVYLSLTTTVSSDGKRSLSMIVTDLTELLTTRGERDSAERDSLAKSEFMATVAHELRNPLGAIRSAVALLERVADENDPGQRPREVIVRQVGHLSRLIDDLLDIERVTAGKVRLDRHPLDLAEAVRHSVANFTGSAGLDRHIEIRTEPMWIDGDAARLEQVFANIVTNAIKYTPSGGHISVSLRGDRDDAVLSVEDTGFGIAPELLPSIFDMFVQGERTLDRAQGGLGIGLTLVRRLVELHGGTVIARSDGNGHGSTFTVRLPRIRPATATARVSPPFERAAPRRVLLIEDNRDARELFGMLLELAGHSVYEAESAYRGLELLESEHPEVAIIDIGLPGLDGYEVARRIRAHPTGAAMLLLALTAYDSPGERKRSLEAGFDHHLVKPVDPDELARLLVEQRTHVALAMTR